MENRKIFVFRISKGNESGNPIGSCSLDYSEIKKVIQNLSESEIMPLVYDNVCLDFIHNEFWKNNTLRQGWGIKNLDLNQETKAWIENYMLSGRIYWDQELNCNHAKGRLNIIRRMKFISKGDFLLIPKTSESRIDDYNKFVVCQVAKEYYFDYPTDIKDFGHCLKIENIKEFKYEQNTLERSDFGSPYLWAITEVRNYHSRFEKIKQFVEKEF